MIILQPAQQLYMNSTDFLLYYQPNSTLKPNSQNSQNNNNNYMLNWISELHNLRLENDSLTLTLD